MVDEVKERESIRMLRRLSLDLKEFSRFNGYLMADRVAFELDYWLNVYDEEEKVKI